MTSARIKNSGTYSRRSLRDLASDEAALSRGVRSRRPPAASAPLPPRDGRDGCRTRPAVRLPGRAPTVVVLETRGLLLGARGRSPRGAPAASPSGVPMTSPGARPLVGGGDVWALALGGGGLSGRDGRRVRAGASGAGPGVGASGAAAGVRASGAGPGIGASGAGAGVRAARAEVRVGALTTGLERGALGTGLRVGASGSRSRVSVLPWRRSARGGRRRCRGDGPPVEAASAASVSASSSGERWGPLNPRRSACDAIRR